ncbi:MAG: proline--tRNA ligase [Clostridiales bacterium]|nr:proline--tRNA ligase [Clostridiales bacterium]
MIKISEIKETASEVFHTELQKRTYQTLCELKIPFHRVDTDKIITMEDCEAVN